MPWRLRMMTNFSFADGLSAPGRRSELHPWQQQESNAKRNQRCDNNYAWCEPPEASGSSRWRSPPALPPAARAPIKRACCDGTSKPVFAPVEVCVTPMARTLFWRPSDKHRLLRCPRSDRHDAFRDHRRDRRRPHRQGRSESSFPEFPSRTTRRAGVLQATKSRSCSWS